MYAISIVQLFRQTGDPSEHPGNILHVVARHSPKGRNLWIHETRALSATRNQPKYRGRNRGGYFCPVEQHYDETRIFM